MAATPLKIQAGETWAKKQKGGSVTPYLVLKSDAAGHVTLQNIANPSSVFSTTAHRMLAAEYYLVSQTPYVDLTRNSKRAKHVVKPRRCPYTVDLFEGRADFQPPEID